MLNKQVVMLTGAAGRIGSVFAKAIVEQDGKVALVDVVEKKGQTLAKELGKDHALYIQADITVPEETDRAIQEAIEYFDGLDAAVHSAYPRSAGWGTRFEELQTVFLKEDLQNQLGGAILFSQRIINHFVKQGHGNLIHLSSIQGIAAPKFEHYQETEMTSPIEYSAIKSGIIAITRWLANYYKNSNIRMNCISPGGILNDQPQSFLDKYRASCTSKGMLQPDDLVGTLIFLLSDSSKYIYGQNITIDDGWDL